MRIEDCVSELSIAALLEVVKRSERSPGEPEYTPAYLHHEISHSCCEERFRTLC